MRAGAELRKTLSSSPATVTGCADLRMRYRSLVDKANGTSISTLRLNRLLAIRAARESDGNASPMSSFQRTGAYPVEVIQAKV